MQKSTERSVLMAAVPSTECEDEMADEKYTYIIGRSYPPHGAPSTDPIPIATCPIEEVDHISRMHNPWSGTMADGRSIGGHVMVVHTRSGQQVYSSKVYRDDEVRQLNQEISALAELVDKHKNKDGIPFHI